MFAFWWVTCGLLDSGPPFLNEIGHVVIGHEMESEVRFCTDIGHF